MKTTATKYNTRNHRETFASTIVPAIGILIGALAAMVMVAVIGSAGVGGFLIMSEVIRTPSLPDTFIMIGGAFLLMMLSIAVMVAAAIAIGGLLIGIVITVWDLSILLVQDFMIWYITREAI